MERKIGEVFKYGCILLKAVETNEQFNNCDSCYFCDYPYGCAANKYVGNCSEYDRIDKKNVVFRPA